MTPIAGYGFVCVVGTLALLYCEGRDIIWGRWIFKIVAAGCFLGLAIHLGGWNTPYGRWILHALGLSIIGDILLIPRDRPAAFLAGLVSFLLAHLVFALAFIEAGIHWRYVGFAALPVLILLGAVVRWLAPHVAGAMRYAVAAYIVVIGGMVSLAAGAWPASPLIPTGAILFAVSDLFVARHRFVRPGMVNKAWGLPLYFFAQMLLAASV